MAASAAARSLAGRVALVTGSSSGIGLGVARVLASKGADVIVHGIAAQDELDRVARAVADAHDVRCVASGADMLGGEAAISELVELGQTAFGRHVDILVNNAGIQVSTDGAGVISPWAASTRRARLRSR